MSTTSSRSKQPHERGELHRRVNEILDHGILVGMPKVAVLSFLRVRQWADFTNCRFKTSLRNLAKHCRFSLASAKRGRDELVEAGVLVQVNGERNGFIQFEIRSPTRRQFEHYLEESRRRKHTRNESRRSRPWK